MDKYTLIVSLVKDCDDLSDAKFAAGIVKAFISTHPDVKATYTLSVRVDPATL